MTEGHRSLAELNAQRQCMSSATTYELTAVPVTYFSHYFGRALDIDFHARALQALHDDTHTPKGRDKLERPDDSEFEEVSMLRDSVNPNAN